MGSTMRVAVSLCRSRHALKIVVAVPVIGRRHIPEFRGIVDDLVIIAVPSDFHAVA